ncbi:cox cluster protein [Halonotius terrestris]|uniref:Cox cluster protein n=1 Tax=Halonotius terrestris TaxID=2487750 RepID=A0A8J8PE00_9EURY|nr:cox cluster protein [Halonotius terrestris]TQQ83386.1 cox cluster protein [Halonotius terrestris]
MDETPGLSDQYRKASPWPLFIALGVPISEIGLVFNVFPVAVGGLLLFCGCVAMMLQEAGYVTTPWPALGGMALLLFVVGAAVFYVDPQVGRDMTMRAYAILASGVVLVAGVIAGRLFVPKRQQPA